MTEKKNQLLLDLQGQRQLSHCPPHFNQVTFDISTNERVIVNWIWENLSGRFFFGDHYQMKGTSVSRGNMCKLAAFEIHSEASYFAIVLPDINKFS
jgi:hypothetical protein